MVPVITLGSLSKRWLVPGWRFRWFVTTDPNDIFKNAKQPLYRSSFHAGRLDNSYSEQNFALGNDGQLWKPDDLANIVLKPCWSKPVLEAEGSRGFVSFSLTNGPEYHIYKIANAVVVARYLRATLIIPDSRGAQHGDWRNFGDIYDIEKFVNSLDGVVKVVKTQPSELSSKNLAVLKVPIESMKTTLQTTLNQLLKARGM